MQYASCSQSLWKCHSVVFHIVIYIATSYIVIEKSEEILIADPFRWLFFPCWKILESSFTSKVINFKKNLVFLFTASSCFLEKETSLLHINCDCVGVNFLLLYALSLCQTYFCFISVFHVQDFLKCLLILSCRFMFKIDVLLQKQFTCGHARLSGWLYYRGINKDLLFRWGFSNISLTYSPLKRR